MAGTIVLTTAGAWSVPDPLSLAIDTAGALTLAGQTVTAGQPACVYDAGYVSARSTFDTNIASYGDTLGDYLVSGASQNDKLAAIYYDSQWVFQQIGTYLGESTPWPTHAESARVVYVENYLEPSFNAQGFRRFPHGIYFDYMASGNSVLSDITELRDNPSFSNLSEYNGNYSYLYQKMSREATYMLQANIYAERAGESRKVQSAVEVPGRVVQWMELWFHQWQSKDYEAGDNAQRFAPFMAALSMHALIEWIEWEEENDRDPNATWNGTYWDSIEDMFGDFLPWMRDTSTVTSGDNVGERMWMTSGGHQTFRYEDIGSSVDSSAAPDLNNLIAFAYAWYADRIKATDPTEAQELMVTADQLFKGCVANGYWAGYKQFNEMTRLAFLYLDVHDTSGLGYCAP